MQEEERSTSRAIAGHTWPFAKTRIGEVPCLLCECAVGTGLAGGRVGRV